MAGLLLLRPAEAEPPADATGIWTIQDENASLSTSSLTDRYYVNGLLLGWTSPTGATPDFLANFGYALFGYGQTRIGVSIEQKIFTPANTQANPPPPGDQPYAGYLTATGSLLLNTDSTRNVLAASIGWIGPPALGEQVQNGFHDIIGQGSNKGWSSQLNAEPALQFLGDRVWRVPLYQLAGLETDALPEVQLGVGTVQDYALAGVNFRIGSGLPSDFGAPRLAPGISGGYAYQPVHPFNWYVFAGVDGQAKAHDEFLQGNNFSSSFHVDMNPLVGEAQFGAALLFWGMRLSYTQVFQSQEFHGQKGGLHQFGAIALSARF
jgi:lipid A 3-O-deacylase